MRYKIYESNGIAKEYYCENDVLIFEGEYLNDIEWIGTRYNENGNILYKLTTIFPIF